MCNGCHAQVSESWPMGLLSNRVIKKNQFFSSEKKKKESVNPFYSEPPKEVTGK